MTTIDGEAPGHTPPATQDEIDRIVKARLERERQYSRKWEERAKQNASDVETWRREARMWETRAKENLAVARAHEKTIARFIDKLDDVLSEED